MNRSRTAFLISGAAAIASTVSARGIAWAADAPNASVSADDAFARLVAGNVRFRKEQREERGPIEEVRLALSQGQSPFATILCCSDSRVVPELAFDQTIGDLFVVRNAGNFVNESIVGTIEYGYSVLGTKLIVVLGHTSCGAIAATYDAIAQNRSLPPHLNVIEDAIRPGLLPIVLAHGTKDEATAANERAQVTRAPILSRILQTALEQHDVRIVAATYTLASGQVDFLL